MKKLLVISVLLLVAFSLVSCGAKKSQVKGDSYVTEGWVDDDTFRVSTVGVPKPGLTNEFQRRGTAKEAALTMAQARVVEMFIGTRIEGAAGAADYASTGVAVRREFEGVVRGGAIIRETYDDEQNCEVVYQVQSKGLKKQVQGGASPLN